MNKFEVTGRLVRPIEHRTDRNGQQVRTKAGKVVAGSSIADQHSKKAGDVSYFRFVVYGDVAERSMKEFGKGDLVHIDGWLKQNRWKGADGKQKSDIEIRVQEICPVFPKGASQPRTGDEIPTWLEDDSDALDD